MLSNAQSLLFATGSLDKKLNKLHKTQSLLEVLSNMSCSVVIDDLSVLPHLTLPVGPWSHGDRQVQCGQPRDGLASGSSLGMGKLASIVLYCIVLFLTALVISEVALQSLNSLPLLTKAIKTLLLRTMNFLETPMAGLRTNFWPSGQPISSNLRGSRKGLACKTR